MAGERQDPKILLVEGVDDEYVVRRLCERHNYAEEFGILDKKGFPNLVPAISPESKVPGRVALGILLDANDNPSGRWDAVTYQLRAAGYTPPARMASNGTIISATDARPRVGIWLMPDNGTKGQLEDFIQKLIPARDPVLPLAAAYIDKIPGNARKFTKRKTQRAKIHAWLAARKEPRKMGQAILAGDLDANAQPAKHFMDWLRQLFG